MSTRFRFAFAFAVVLVAATAADAAADRKVFLNGIDLTGVALTGQEFASCTVKFDGDGNVHITAPGVDIQKREAEGPSNEAKAAGHVASARLTKRYYLASKGMRSGKVQFDVAVYVNRKRVKTLRNGDTDAVTEITRHLFPGNNKVRLVAVKSLGKSGKRRSYSPSDKMEILLGEGTASKGVVTLSTTVVDYKRNASETGKFADTFKFTTR